MKTQRLQNKLDNIIEKLFLWAFPRNFEPNWLSIFRILTVPFIYLLLTNSTYIWAFGLFVLSASTDFIDGTMARKRQKITDLGKILDPIADKLLIATILFALGFQYLIVKVFLVVIFFEILAIFLSSLLAYKIGRPVGANFYGKIKMVLQSLSVGLFLVGLIWGLSAVITFSEYVLAVALFFAILSGIEIARLKLPIIKKAFRDLLHLI